MKACRNLICLIIISASTAAGASEPEHNVTAQYIKNNDVDNTKNVSPQLVDPFTLSTIGGFILDKAKNAVAGKITSLLMDAIFGNSGVKGPQYVLLHDRALQQIEDIVSEKIITSDVEDAKSQLASFGDLIEYYNASAGPQGKPDLSSLPTLIDYATSLKNHAAYNSGYNENAYLLTSSYSLVSSLTIAVLTERELNNQIGHEYVASVASSLQAKLSSLGSQVDQYIEDEIYMYSSNKCERFGICYFRVSDGIGKSSGKIFNVGEGAYGTVNEASNAAYEYSNKLKKYYKDVIKGEDFSKIISILDNF